MEELLSRIAVQLERLRIEDYLRMQQNVPKMLIRHFGFGVMRGLGFAVGFSLLGAIAIALIRETVIANLPGFGQFLSDIIRAAQSRM